MYMYKSTLLVLSNIQATPDFGDFKYQEYQERWCDDKYDDDVEHDKGYTNTFGGLE